MTNNDKKDLKLKKYLETCTGRNILLKKQKIKTKNLLFMGSFFWEKQFKDSNDKKRKIKM